MQPHWKRVARTLDKAVKNPAREWRNAVPFPPPILSSTDAIPGMTMMDAALPFPAARIVARIADALRAGRRDAGFGNIATLL